MCGGGWLGVSVVGWAIGWVGEGWGGGSMVGWVSGGVGG